VIVFRPLSRTNMELVIEMELKKVTKRLTEHGLTVEITAEAKEFLMDKGYSPDFGARPLRRAIEHNVEDPLAEDILRGAFKGKDLIRITIKDEGDGNKHLYFEAVSTGTGEEQQLVKAASDAT
jgi:ATP-dependent Clp protease ATP-binding subunit ClpC